MWLVRRWKRRVLGTIFHQPHFHAKKRYFKLRIQLLRLIPRRRNPNLKVEPWTMCRVGTSLILGCDKSWNDSELTRCESVALAVAARRGAYLGSTTAPVACDRCEFRMSASRRDNHGSACTPTLRRTLLSQFARSAAVSRPLNERHRQSVWGRRTSGVCKITAPIPNEDASADTTVSACAWIVMS